jgi:DNA-directed RNA polymerase specialized sigma24 family protein
VETAAEVPRRSGHPLGLELYCYLMVGGDVTVARRVLADAVLTAWRERGFVGPETDARMWLYKLASRVCIEVAGDHLPDRSRPRQLPMSHDEKIDDAGQRVLLESSHDPLAPRRAATLTTPLTIRGPVIIDDLDIA